MEGEEARTLTVLYDGGWGFCTRQARLARARRRGAPHAPGVDGDAGSAGALRPHGGRRAPAAYVRDGSGRLWGARARWPGWYGPSRWWGWWAVYLVPGLRQVADALYGWVSTHRQEISRRLGVGRPVPVRGALAPG